MMKKILLLVIGSFTLGACGASPNVSNKPIVTKATVSDRQKETVAAHSVDKQKETKNLPAAETAKKVEKTGKKTKWTRSGSPIDTTKFDEEIAAAEKALKANSSDPGKKAALAEAYFKRGFALTEARQYASAIGDYRRSLKQVPDHAEAKKWISTIANIYKTMNREIPADGQEPKPLDFKIEEKPA